jgi:hypothetical protein
MTLKNYEYFFTIADFSNMSHELPEVCLPVILSVFFQQLAQEKHDYVNHLLLTTIIEQDIDYGYYQEVPRMIATPYFNNLIKQNPTLLVIHNLEEKLNLKSNQNYCQQLAQIDTIKDAMDYVCDITADDYFNSEVKKIFELAHDYQYIMLEKEQLERQSENNIVEFKSPQIKKI